MPSTASAPATTRPSRPLRSVAPIDDSPSPRASAMRFSETVRVVVALARRLELRPPVFRSPPRLDGVDRSIRRRPNGTVVVAIRRDARPLAAVQADVIEGVVAANSLGGEQADRFRRAAWSQLEGVPDGTPPRQEVNDRRPCAQVA